MPRKDKVIHISNLPSTFRGNVTRNGRFIQNGIPPLGGVYDKVAKSTGLIRLGNEFLYNGVNNLVSKDNREKLMNNTAGRLINYVKDFNKESFPSDDELGPTFPFNIIQTPRSNGKNLPQKQYAIGGKVPNVVAGGIAQPLGNNFFYMNGRKHSQGGIDIGPSDKTGIEVEGGEVVETNGNELKVYSAQPILNGVSPAKLVMDGANPNKVFKAQEDFKDRNGINDDGTKAKYGKEKYVVKSNNTRVTPIMESPRNSGIKQGDFIYYPETYRIANNTLEKVPARKEVNTDYELPYLLRYGKSARTELSKNKNIPYKDIISKVNKDYSKFYGYNEYIANHIKKFIDDPNIKYKPSYNVIGNPKNDYINYVIGNKISNLPTYNPSKHNVRKYVYDILEKKGIDVNSPGIGVTFGDKNFKVVNYNNDINRELRKSKRISNNELKEYIKSKGIHPENKKYNVITSEELSKTSRNKGNPYQHFIFTGDVGKQGLEVIDVKDVNSEVLKGISNTRNHFGKYTKGYSRKSRKLGGKNMIISINGNVKNGLIHSPSSTGGLRDKFAVGGNRINRHGRTLEYDEKIGAYVPITNRTISRTSAYPINKSARGETIVGSDYTFRNGRWSKNNTTNTNTNKSNIDNGNRRPQYYAERRLPLFEDGAGITSGLVRAGWSHGNNRGISTNNTNIPSLSETKSSGKTPRGGRSKSSQSTQSVPTKTPPTAVYNRNLPKIEASIPTTLPVSTSTPAKGTISSDGKGQGRFKNITTADWIGLGSNVAGSLASYFASKRAINKMRGPGQPTLISANKLKTKYNINPQLDRIREDKFEAYRDIDSNTASSRVSLARKQRVRNAAGQAANELYGNKENIETNLINQDKRNQQNVRQFNAQQYNQYIDRKTAFDNGIREAKVTNINNLFSGINAGIQDMISRYENRKALNNTIGAMRASAPNVDDRIMRDAGVDYDEFIIRKRRKLGGKQSCR